MRRNLWSEASPQLVRFAFYALVIFALAAILVAAREKTRVVTCPDWGGVLAESGP